MNQSDGAFSPKQDFPLHYYAKLGDHEHLSSLLETDTSAAVKEVGRHDFEGRSVLHYAAMGGNWQFVYQKVSKLLFFAVNLNGGQKCVEVILNFLSNLSENHMNDFLGKIKAVQSRPMKHQWKSSSPQPIIDFVNLDDIYGETALHIAARNEDASVVVALLTHSADVLAVYV